ncbi:MAG: hypothetical protein H8K06_13235 [Nitrospira sp.]|mgnify:CR=1 FL=1|nr:hypothetical protein [Nitrospira sp.]
MRLYQVALVIGLIFIGIEKPASTLAEGPREGWLGAFVGSEIPGALIKRSSIAVGSQQFSPSASGSSLAVLHKVVEQCRTTSKGRAMVNIRIVNTLGEMSEQQTDKKTYKTYPGSLLITVYGDCVLEVQDMK